MLVTLKNVRLAFPSLFTPTAYKDGDKPYYSATFPVKPGSENHKALNVAIETVVKEALGAKAKGRLESLREKQRVFYKDGPKTNKDGDPYAGFEDMNNAKCSNAQRLVVVGRDGTIATDADGIFYAGCIVNAKVDVWFHNVEGGRVNGRLLGIQFVKDAEAFGGGVRINADAFEALEDEEELDLD